MKTSIASLFLVSFTPAWGFAVAPIMVSRTCLDGPTTSHIIRTHRSSRSRGRRGPGTCQSDVSWRTDDGIFRPATSDVTDRAVRRRSVRNLRSWGLLATVDDSDGMPADDDESAEELERVDTSSLLEAGAGAGAFGGLAAAMADLEEPGKLVREAVKPFQDEMDRIEADFSKRVEENTDDMERKMEEMLKGLDTTD